MFKRILYILCAVAVVSVGIIYAADVQAADTDCMVFNEAQDAFNQAGMLEKDSPEQARQLYLKAYHRYAALAAEDTDNAAVYYNLGNTCFRLGRTGEAILNYKKALKLHAHDENILHNLEIARTQRKDSIQQQEETRIVKALLFWHYDVSRAWRLDIFAVCFVLFWAVLIARSIFKGGKRIPGVMLIVLGVLWVALLSSLVIEPIAAASHIEGVITAKDAIAREGNGENYKPCFKTPLHEGTEFVVFEERPGWYGVELADGRKCWLPEQSCGVVK